MIINILSAAVVGGVNYLLIHIKEVYDIDIFANPFIEGAALCILSLSLANSISDIISDAKLKWYFLTRKK